MNNVLLQVSGLGEGAAAPSAARQVTLHRETFALMSLPIHPSSSTYLGSGCGGSSLSMKLRPLSSCFDQLFQGTPEVFLGQPRDLVFPACPPERHLEDILTKCPSHLIWLLSTLYSELL